MDWADASTKGARVLPCLLIAGIPNPLVPPGCDLTGVSWTHLPDGAWHCGIAPVALPWLGVGGDAPALVIDEVAHPIAEQPIDVGSLSVWIEDVDRVATKLLGSRRVLPQARLTQTLEVGDTVIHVDLADPFASLPTPFVVHIGREALSVSSVDTGAATLSISAHGLYGTRARRHVVVAGMGAPAVYGPRTDGALALPSLVGRRATLWALRMTGTTTVDPELLFDGRVGAGIQPVAGAYALPIDHCTKELNAQFQEQRVTVAGYAHPSVPGGIETPLAIFYDDGVTSTTVTLTSVSAPPHDGGWHASRGIFLDKFRDEIAARGIGATLRLDLSADNILTVSAIGGAVSITVTAAWAEHYGASASGVDPIVTIPTPMPESCAWLDETVHLAALDMARVPPVPAPFPTGHEGEAFWALDLETDEGQPQRRAKITAVGASTITVARIGAGDYADMLVTEATPATLQLYVKAADWLDALQYGVVAAGEQLGLDWLEDSIDWTSIGRVARSNRSGFPTAREYMIDAETPVLDLLRREAMVNGLALVPLHGRVSMVRIRDIAPTEPVVAEVLSRDLDAQDPIPGGEESRDGLATRVVFEMPAPSKVAVTLVDAAAEVESGRGQDVKVRVPPGAVPNVVDGAMQMAMMVAAQSILGPFRSTALFATLRLPLAYCGVQVGQDIRATDWYLPSGTGTRGLLGAVVRVLGRQVDLSNGLVTLSGLVGSGDLAGYAPEAVVASISGAVLTIDTSVFGPQGFADELLVDGSTRTDGGASCFVAGDYVRLREVDTTTPAAPLSARVLSVSGTSITLDVSPGGTWAARAAAGLALTPPGPSVFLSFDAYATATRGRTGSTPAQHEYAFLADGTTRRLGGTDAARRFA